MLPSTIAGHYIMWCSHPAGSNICHTVTINLGNLTAQDYMGKRCQKFNIYISGGNTYILNCCNLNKNKTQSREKMNNIAVKTLHYQTADALKETV
jgi:hypothetical protein